MTKSNISLLLSRETIQFIFQTRKLFWDTLSRMGCMVTLKGNSSAIKTKQRTSKTIPKAIRAPSHNQVNEARGLTKGRTQ